MRFAFTDEQTDFRDAVRDLLARECPPAVVRAAWENADGRSGGVWDLLAESAEISAVILFMVGLAALFGWAVDTIGIFNEFARWLTIEKGVAVIPVSAFMPDGTDYGLIRFCFAKKDATLRAAAERLRAM